MYKDNPEYTREYVSGKYSIYIPTNIATGYHERRKIEATVQAIYSNAGATRDVLEHLTSKMLEIINEGGKTAMSDVAVLLNNIQYRLKYPIDQHCAVRMGAILSFLEIEDAEGLVISHEDANNPQSHWLSKKLELADSDPDMYTFFFTWGFANTEAYRQQPDILTDMTYFRTRQEAIAKIMMPISTHSKK